jgi:hypothetical protein
MTVEHHTLMPVPHQAPHHVAAHATQANHANLHL